MSLTGTTNEEKIWNYLSSRIGNDYGVAGLMGNMYVESGLSPTNMENSYESKLGYTDATYTKAVDDGTYTNFVKDAVGYGLCQFTYWTLKQSLLDEAHKQKKSVGDLEMQLGFTCDLLKSSYPKAWTALTTAKNVASASNSVLLDFERPADQSSAAQSKRASYGTQYYEKYAKNTNKEDKHMASAQQVLAQLAALAGENEAVLGSNNTTVNKYFGAKGQPYCGYSLWYAAKKAGSGIWNGCSNPAYVPTIKSFFAARKVSNSQAQPGDIFAYKSDHVGFVYAVISGTTVITLEGNSTVYKTEAEARNSSVGSGAYEGIGYKKRNLTSDFTIYRPAYEDASGTAPFPTPVPAEKVGPAVTVSLNLIKNGHSGPQVKTFQRICYAYGIKGADGKAIEVDGEFGANCVAAAKTLQQRLGVSADGEVGKDTWTAILTKLA